MALAPVGRKLNIFVHTFLIVIVMQTVLSRAVVCMSENGQDARIAMIPATAAQSVPKIKGAG
ncbi:hypothetical protein [Paenarthrobacter sp. 2TAF44]|uniref:hypothetical protein n=1 Tax=Paenarthrobacter sp. 2TAF44 TaxID=3233018 RepID=UPI0010D5BDB8|nr:hypothetical protein EYS21_16770 [Arthrobacter sp. S39]